MTPQEKKEHFEKTKQFYVQHISFEKYLGAYIKVKNTLLKEPLTNGVIDVTVKHS